jgi:hypothetical protein
MKPTAIVSFLLFILLINFNSRGSERVFTNDNFAISVPDGWEEIKNTPKQGNMQMLGLFRSPGKNTLLMLMFEANPRNPEVIDDRYVADLEGSLQQGGQGQPMSSRFLEIGGVKAYERQGTMSVNGKTVSVLFQVMIADRKTYGMQAMRFGGNVADDGDVLKSMASFRFLTPPKPLSPLAGKSPAYQMGHDIGQLSMYAAVLVAIGVIIAVSLRGAGRRAKAGSKPPSRPPPLPNKN